MSSLSPFRSPPPQDPEDPRSPLRSPSSASSLQDSGEDPHLPPVPHNTPIDTSTTTIPPPLPLSLPSSNNTTDNNPSSTAIVNFSTSSAAAPARDEPVISETKPSSNHVAATSEQSLEFGRRRRKRAARRAGVVARAAAAGFCLVAFAVMAADKNKGWAVDSFSNYKQYRYSVTVNVLGFLYSGFQAYAEVYHLMHGKYIVRRSVGSVFDFVMDQTFAYLLISASSSATTRTDEWVSNWGKDPFPSMAMGSIAVSYFAFLAFAVSSLISAYNLFKSGV